MRGRRNKGKARFENVNFSCQKVGQVWDAVTSANAVRGVGRQAVVEVQKKQLMNMKHETLV